MYTHRCFKDLFFLSGLVAVCILFTVLDYGHFIFNDFLYKIHIVICILYLSIVLLSIEDFGSYSLDLSKRISIIYIVLTPLRYYQAILTKKLILSDLSSQYVLQIAAIGILLEILLYIIHFKSIKKYTCYSKELLYTISLFAATALTIYIILYFFNLSTSFQYIHAIYITMNVISLLLSIALIFVIKKSWHLFTKAMRYNLVMFLVFFLIHKFFLFSLMLQKIDWMILIRLLCNLCYAYFLFKFIKIRIRAITISDLTSELKSSQKQLKTALNELEELLYLLPVAAFVCNEDTLVFANKKFLEMFHIEDTQKIVGRQMSDIVPSDIYQQYLNATQIPSPDMEPLPVQLSFQLKKFTYNIEVSTILLTHKERSKQVALVRDLSDKKQKEELAAELFKKELDDQLKNEFLSIMSHEFKTPVNVIYSALKLQESSIETDNTASLYKCTHIIKQNCHRLIRLINNLLDITSLEADYLKPSFKTYNIVPIIENITDALADFIQKHHLTLTFDTNEEEIYVTIDSAFLERILLNILSNAVKYSNPPGHIFITLHQYASFVTISIKDDGIGMPADKLDFIFNRFARIDNTLNRKHEGCGIGLNLVKGLVELLKGEIKIISKENIGTEVILTFNLSDKELFKTTNASHLLNNTITLSDKISIEFSDIYLHSQAGGR